MIVVFWINNRFRRNSRAHCRQRWAHFLESYIICFQENEYTVIVIVDDERLTFFLLPSFLLILQAYADKAYFHLGSNISGLLFPLSPVITSTFPASLRLSLAIVHKTQVISWPHLNSRSIELWILLHAAARLLRMRKWWQGQFHARAILFRIEVQCIQNRN